VKDRLLKAATEKERHSNHAHAQMKDVAKKFVPRIKKWFGADIVAAINRKTPLQDAETLLGSSTKITYRWAAGIITSNHIATLLIQLSRFRRGEK
jgi:queuine/archaeosine tRNA-ribosyltransferase